MLVAHADPETLLMKSMQNRDSVLVHQDTESSESMQREAADAGIGAPGHVFAYLLP